jgi:hypothetical protein
MNVPVFKQPKRLVPEVDLVLPLKRRVRQVMKFHVVGVTEWHPEEVTSLFASPPGLEVVVARWVFKADEAPALLDVHPVPVGSGRLSSRSQSLVFFRLDLAARWAFFSVRASSFNLAWLPVPVFLPYAFVASPNHLSPSPPHFVRWTTSLALVVI